MLLRLERGEEILGSLKRLALEARIPGASLNGLGALDEAVISFYDVGARIYRDYLHRGVIEVTALTGNISWKGNDPVAHVHLTAFEETTGAFGGHLVRGVVSATIEITLDLFDDRLERKPDEAIGLPLLDLPDWKKD